MSRKKTDKFFMYAPKRRGHDKGKRLMGLNYKHEGEINLQDLIDFLKTKEIDPSKVPLPSSFSVYVSP